jgi:hypothetical protein
MFIGLIMLTASWGLTLNGWIIFMTGPYCLIVLESVVNTL